MPLAAKKLARGGSGVPQSAGAGGRRATPAERAVLVGQLRAVVAVDGAGLEQREVGPAAGDVVARGVEQRAQERGAHHRVVLAHRVLEGHEAPARVVGRQAQPVGQPGVGEAPAHDLVQAAADERVDGAAAQALPDGQPPRAAAALGQRGRQLLEAVDARDLLDEVGLASDVVAPEGGHEHVEAARRLLDAEAQRAQDLGLARARDRAPEELLDAVLAQADDDAGRAVAADVDRAGHEPRAGQLEHQPRGDDLGLQRLLGRQALLEAPARLAAQAQDLRGAVDVGAVPVGALHQHARRARREPRSARRP